MADQNDKPVPYTFVPVISSATAEQKRLFDAVFHEGTLAENQTYLSGELHCTLHALTPLLVGQKRYKASHIAGVSQAKKSESVTLPGDWGPVGGSATHQELDAEKGILEPMLVAITGQAGVAGKRVVIPGSSLKGMLRHNLGAMLSAPMERVGEQYFSYRPNLYISKDKNPQYQTYPAIVIEANKQEKTITVVLVEKDGLLKYEKLTEDFRILINAHGIDSEGKMAEIAGKPIRNISRKMFINRKEKYRRLVIPQVIVQQYLTTHAQLADTRWGHLSRPPYANHPDKNKLADRISSNNQSIFEKFRLIYVEAELQDGRPVRIVSFGHHFRYRWRYADTVRTVQVEKSGNNLLRQSLKPLVGEGISRDSAQLSGARLLFGYAVDPSPMSGTAGLGEGHCSWLAGRISINHAVEYIKNDALPLRERFVQRHDANHQSNDLSTFNIPLKILGTPKASAVEHYLVQDQVNRRGLSEHTVTYGDLPGVLPSASELSGRKFYRHQPMAAQQHGLFELTENRHNKQATLARFISKPGSQFRFTLRFKDLRLWEIGAVMIALRPELLVEHRGSLPPEYQKLIDKAIKLRKPTDKGPVFALKLGYGRPLGLGSVHIAIDQISQVDDNAPLLTVQAKQAWLDSAIQAFLKQLKTSGLSLVDWLAAVLYAGRGEAAYPTAPDRQGHREIFDYHTQIRRDHAKIRRLKANSPSRNLLDDRVKPGYPDDPFKLGK